MNGSDKKSTVTGQGDPGAPMTAFPVKQTPSVSAIGSKTATTYEQDFESASNPSKTVLTDSLEVNQKKDKKSKWGKMDQYKFYFKSQ